MRSSIQILQEYTGQLGAALRMMRDYGTPPDVYGAYLARHKSKRIKNKVSKKRVRAGRR